MLFSYLIFYSTILLTIFFPILPSDYSHKFILVNAMIVTFLVLASLSPLNRDTTLDLSAGIPLIHSNSNSHQKIQN